MTSLTVEQGRKGGSSLHQLAPYIGKLPVAMTARLITRYSKPGDLVLDPFAGSGTVPLEAALAGRHATAYDTSPYAVAITRGKLFPPATEAAAIRKARSRMIEAKAAVGDVDLRTVPAWVRRFFHPETLRETIALTRVLRDHEEYFLMGCLLGILHHQRAGFLSYPSSHFSPYLRTNLFPREKFPELYQRREVLPRLEKKIRRAYQGVNTVRSDVKRVCERLDASKMRLAEGSVDAVITSPPYMNELDYGRDNRLRLWLLGHDDYRQLDSKVNTRERFLRLMRGTFRSIKSALIPGGYCVMVVGESRRSHSAVDVARLLSKMATDDIGGFDRVSMRQDSVPAIKRTVVPHEPREEWIVVLRRC